MATTSKYFVLPSAGDDFVDFELSYGTLSLQAQEIVFVGSTRANAVFVRPGISVDFTGSVGGVDKVYLEGSLNDYAITTSGTSFLILTRGSGDTLETVKVAKDSRGSAASDVLVFADGTVNTYELYDAVASQSARPAPSGETSLAPAAPAAPGSVLNASIKAFALDASGETFAMAKHGIALTVVGGIGVDTVYVPDGGNVDATGLVGGADWIYFRGSWADYSKSVVSSVITFTRSVDGMTETVKVVGGIGNSNDHLVFADGAVFSNDARAAINANANVAISAIVNYDANTTTPGIDTTPPALTVAAVGDGNLTATEATAVGGVVSVTTEVDASVSVVFTGSGGQVTKTLTGTGAAQPVTLSAADLASLGEGTVTVATSARDAAGNTASANTGGFTLDTLAPELTVAAAGDGDLTAAEAAAGIVTVNAEAGAMVSVTLTGPDGHITKNLTGNGGNQSVALSGADLAELGQGAVTVASSATDAAGNSTSGEAIEFNLDSVAPVLMSAEVDADKLILTYDELNGLDDINKAQPGDFSVTVTRLLDSGVTHPVVTGVSVNANANTVTLTLDTPVAYKSTVTLSYADSSAGANAIQDIAGNDAANFSGLNVLVPNGKLADGYIRDAHIYIDTNGDGTGDHDTGVFTNASGNFFLPPGTPTGTIIATGGVNIDTGVPNTLVYKAPAGSTTVSPLTTLVQTYAETNSVDAAAAETAVQTALGLPDSVDLLTFDPLAAAPDDADAVTVQKAAAQIATIAMLAASDPTAGATADAAAAAGQDVIDNLVTMVTGAGAGSVNLSNSGTATSLINPSITNVSTTAVSDAAAAIGGASTLGQISGAQSVALDTIAPAAPIAAPDLTIASDSGRLNNDDITNDNTPTVRVRVNTGATDGTAAVAGDTAQVYDGAALVGSGILSATDITNGYIDVTTSVLGEGIHGLTAKLIDVAGNIGTASASLGVNIDTLAPGTSISGIALSADTGASNSDFITRSAAQTVSASLSAPLVAGEFLYGSTNGGATWSDISGGVSGTNVTWNTLLRAGANSLQFKVADSAGNSGPVASQAYILDTTQPTLTVTAIGDGNLSRAEATGAGVVSVSAESGSQVSVTFTGSAGGFSKTLTASGATQAVVLDAADLTTLGNGAVSVATIATDVAGNTRLSLAGGFTLDASAPATPGINTVAGNDSVNAAEKATGVSLSGSAETGTSVAVTWGGTTQTVTAAGNAWTANFSGAQVPADGSTTVSVSATDGAGNVSATATRAVMIDSAAPETPIVTPADTTVIDHNGSLYLNNGQFNVSGLEAGATWQYTLNSGATWLNGVGTSFILPEGTYGDEVQVRQIDAAGNPGTPDINAGQSVIVDTSAPVAPVLSLAADTGVSAADGITSNGQVNVTGLEAGATWQYSTNSGGAWNTGSGTSFTLAAGSYAAGTVQVRQSDLAGNTSASASNAGSLVIDATAPVFQSATVNGASLVLTYGEALDAANAAAAGTFAVTVNGVGRGVSSVAVSGGSVTLTLASAVLNGETVTVAYADPSVGNDANAIQDAAGNDAASLPATGVTNNTPAIPVNDAPVFWMLNDGRVLAGIDGYDLNAKDLLLQGDGKIVVPGAINDNTPSNFNFSVLRFGADGRLDTTFDGDGIASTALAASYDEAMGGVILADGKILVAGQVINGGTNYDFALVRYNADGSLDTTFGSSGITLTSISTHATYDDDKASGLALQADGKIVVVGTSQGVSGSSAAVTALARYSGSGALDTTFDGDGKLVSTAASTTGNSANVVEVLADGKILVAGSSYATDYGFALWRFSSTGTLDATFGAGGVAKTDFGSGSDSIVDLSILADGKILVAGNANVTGSTGDIALARYSANGVLDTTFGSSGKAVIDLGLKETVSSVAVLADGKILVSGVRDSGGLSYADDFFVMRLNADGSQDTGFGSNGLVSLPFTSTAFNGTTASGAYLELQSDGKLLLAGGVAGTASGSQRVALLRLNADGSPDTEFGAIARYTEGGAAVVLDGDVALFDAELTPADNFNGASLTLARHGGASAQDVFSASGNLGALGAGAALSVGGTSIGTVTSNANGTLQLTFNAAATQTLVNKAMQQIAYSNTSTTPPASVQIDWTFNDGNAGAQGIGGALGASGHTTVLISDVPTFTAATVNGASLVLSYDEALDAAHAPAAGAFAVTVNGIARGVSAVAVSGSNVTLTLASAVASTDTVTVAYTDPTVGNDANAIQDSAGNDAASLAARAVSNTTPGVDVTAPLLQSATLSDSTITLTYNEALDPAHQPASSFYQVATLADGTGRSVNNIAISGNTVLLTLSNPITNGLGVTLSYADPTAGNNVQAIQDLAGNDAAGYTMAVTNNTPAGDVAGSPRLVGATVTETANATVSLIFTETMQASTPGNVAIYVNGTGNNVFTGVAGTSGQFVTFNTTATITATDYLVFSYYGGSDLRDLGNQSPSIGGSIVIGASGVSNIDLSEPDWSKLTGNSITIRSNNGEDILVGTGGNDVLIGGRGADTIKGSWGADRINLNEGARASDTVVAAADLWSSGSQPYHYDTVFAFDVSSATVGAASTNDKLNLPSGSIAADVSHVNGADFGGLAQHSIDTGILTFENAAGAAILINPGNLAAATDYLEANITQAGATVGFAYDSDGNGYADSLFVFQNQGGRDLDNDSLILLAGVNGVTLGNVAGQNMVQIVDTTGPTINDADFSANALNLYFSEPIVSADFAGLTLQKGSGATLSGLTPSGVVLNGSVATVSFAAANLAGTNYILITPSDRAHQSGTDGFGNSSLIFPADEVGGAIGGSGDTVIDLSGLAGNWFLYDPDGGNDTLIGNASDNDMEGGTGNDGLQGGGGNDYLNGGTGADNLDGGSGADEFSFTQGDSTPVSYSGGAYTFTGGADIISGGFTTTATNNNPDSGDRVYLRSEMPGNGMASMSTPVDHLVTDQHYFLERGNYSGGVFTVNAAGADTLVVYDGDSNTGAVSQTALVIQGVLPSQLTSTDWGTIYLSGGVADTTPPVFQRATVDGASMVIDYNEVLSSTLPGAGAFVVMVDGVARGVSGINRSQTGESLFLSLVSPVNAGQTVTLTYTDPTAGDDVNATQDLAGNDAASLSAQVVSNLTGGGGSDYTYISGSPAIGQPHVTDVRAQHEPTDNIYAPGDTVVEYVYLDQSVLVTGAPQLQLVIGTAGAMHTVLANYDAAHSGGNQLAFSYTLQAADIGQMSIGNLYTPTGSSITNLAGSQSAFARIDNTGNNQACTWLYGAASTTGTAGNDWIAPPAGTDLGDAAKLTTALSGLNAGAGGERDLLVFNLKYFGGTLSETVLANGYQFDIDSRVIRVLNESGAINLYEVVSGTPQLVKTLYSGGAGFERMMMVLTDAAGTPLGPDYVADFQLVKDTYTDLIRNHQMNLGSDFADTITLAANPSAYQMVWPGNGNDIVTGSDNGDHSDVSDGNDSISLGGGNDHFGWWGVGNSTLDGGSGTDTLTLSGGIAPTLSGAITHVLGADGKVHLYAGATEFAFIEKGGASDSWQYRMTTSSGDGTNDMVVTLKDIEYFQVGNQSDYLYLPLGATLFDTIAPYNTAASFGGNQITVSFSEVVTASGGNGLSLTLNPTDANGWQGTPIMITGVAGLGTSSTITFTTDTTFAATDVVRLQYNANWGDLRDLAGNPAPTGEIWFGDNGTGATVIDLDWYTPWNGGTVFLRGNGGPDRLVGTAYNDIVIDGGGADSVTGSWGADIVRLIENGSSIGYLKDVVNVAVGESYAFFQGVDTSDTTMDTVDGSLTSPTGTGFDISSATVANHDVLDLTAKLIAANASHADGIDVGVFAKHSITSGIITFENTAGTAILINESNVQDAAIYARMNFTTPGITGAFKMDTDGNGSVDSLVVIQDHGSSPLLGIDLPETAILLQNLIGIGSVTLGTTAGANVVQIQDTHEPEPVAMALTADGMRFNFAENTFVPATGAASLALTLQKNGAGAALAPSSVDGNGGTDMVLRYAVTLTPGDWAMMHYAGTGTANGIRDANGNALIEDAGGFSFAEGGSGNNTINLSALSAGYDINGKAGDDTLIGSSGGDWISGGSGADTMTGGAGSDDFNFEQGDSPVTVFHENGGAGVSNGDTFSFANGVDRITDLSGGEGIGLHRAMSDLLGNASSPSFMGATPSNGLVTDKGYFVVQGNYLSGTFTVNDAGADTLLVWDGDSTTGVTQTAIVLSGVQAAQLGLGTGYVHLQSTSGFSSGNDTYTLPAPTVLGQTVDALGGSDTLVIPAFPSMIMPEGPGLHFGNVLDPNSIGASEIVYTLSEGQFIGDYYLEGSHGHDLLSAQPVADYGLSLLNFENLRFDNGVHVLDINLASDVGVVQATQAVGGVLDGTTLAASYLFASYEVGAGVTQVIGGAQLADTAGLAFEVASGELQMNKVDGANPVWRFMEGSNEVFNITESGNNWAVDYGYNGAGIDVTLSGMEYALVFDSINENTLLRLNFQTGEPTVIV